MPSREAGGRGEGWGHTRGKGEEAEAWTQTCLPPRTGQVAPAPGRGSQEWWGGAAHPLSLPHQTTLKVLGWSCPGKKWVPVPGQQGPGHHSRGVELPIQSRRCKWGLSLLAEQPGGLQGSPQAEGWLDIICNVQRSSARSQGPAESRLHRMADACAHHATSHRPRNADTHSLTPPLPAKPHVKDTVPGSQDSSSQHGFTHTHTHRLMLQRHTGQHTHAQAHTQGHSRPGHTIGTNTQLPDPDTPTHSLRHHTAQRMPETGQGLGTTIASRWRGCTWEKTFTRR